MLKHSHLTISVPYYAVPLGQESRQSAAAVVLQNSIRQESRRAWGCRFLTVGLGEHLLCVEVCVRTWWLVWAFSGCGAQAQYLWLEGSRVRDRELWCGGLVDPWRVESSWTGDRTCVPCIGRQIIICCSTSEVLGRSLKIHHQANSCGYWQVPSSLLSIRWSHSFHPCEPLRSCTHSMGTWFCQSEG